MTTFMNKKRKPDNEGGGHKKLRTDVLSSASSHAALAAAPSPAGEDAANAGFGRADPSTLFARRSISGAGAGARAGARAGVGAVTPSGARTSRQKRQALYLAEIGRINAEFAAGARKVLDSVARGEKSIPGNEFYLADACEYLRLMKELQRRYDRPHGDVMVCGSGDCGQLGLSQAVDIARRVRLVRSLRALDVDQVAGGGLHTLALSADGTVRAWGTNDDGSLGTLDIEDDGYVPARVTGFHPSVHGFRGPRAEGCVHADTGRTIPFSQRKDEDIMQLAAGETLSVAVSTTGNVYSWGSFKDNDNRSFRNCLPEDDDRPKPSKKEESLEDDDHISRYMPPRGHQNFPTHETRIRKKAKYVSAGAAFAAAILEDDTLVTWGVAACGEMGRPVPKLTKETPDDLTLREFLAPLPPIFAGLQTRMKRSVAAVACGAYHVLVLAKDTDASEELKVYSSGLNNYGQLGHGVPGEDYNVDKLTMVEALIGHNIAQIDGGFHHSCFLDETGKKLYLCGRGDYGQLGITTGTPDSGYCEATPTRVPLVYEPAATVDTTKNCVVEDDIDEEAQPVIVQISAGSYHNLVLTNNGVVYSWGFGEQVATGHAKVDALGGSDGRVTDECDDPDVTRPMRLDLTRMGKNKDTDVTVRQVSGGGQHSAMVTTSSKTR